MKIRAIFGTLLLVSIGVLTACASGAPTPLAGSNGGAPSSGESGGGAPSGGTTSSGSGTASGDGSEESDTGGPAEAAEPRRMIKITEIEGTVEVMANGSAEFVPAQVGQELREGDEMRTGADGRVTFMLDDGTAAIVTENASLKVTTISGTHESPITRFFMSVGEIITVHEGELPADAAYEIETPDGVAAIRGSSLVVRYDPVTKKMTAACLTGTCLVTQPDGEIVQVEPGQVVEVQQNGAVSEPRDISPDEQEVWDGVIFECECEFDPTLFDDPFYDDPNDDANTNDNSENGGSDVNDSGDTDSGETDGGSGTDGDDTGDSDGGTTDTSGTDSDSTDSGTDTSGDDTSGTDSGTTDTSGTDSGSTDSGTDSGTTDSGTTDTSGSDSGSTDTGGTDTDTTDSGGTDTGG